MSDDKRAWRFNAEVQAALAEFVRDLQEHFFEGADVRVAIIARDTEANEAVVLGNEPPENLLVILKSQNARKAQMLVQKHAEPGEDREVLMLQHPTKEDN